MQFVKLLIDNEKESTGIKECNVDFRTNCSVLVGKNGSGKTRILNIINNKILGHPIKNLVDQNILKKIPNYLQQVLNDDKRARPYVKSLISFIKPDHIKQYLKTNSPVGEYNFESIIENQPELYIENEFELLTKTAIFYFETLPTKLIVEKLDYYEKEGNFKRTKVYQQFKSLREKFESLIGKELDYKKDKSTVVYSPEGASGLKGIWTIDDRRYNYDELSEGEKTLLSYILLLYLQEQYPYAKSKNSIILIDEPEIHLHPEAQIKLIEGLRNLIGNEGQLIIATHSLPIMSLFTYDEIFLVKNNSIFPPNSSIPQRAMEELISLSNLETHLRSFLTDISDWSFHHFMIQNFKNPNVVETSNKSDPQFKLFVQTMTQKEIALLDYGCGKGRLEKLLKEEQSLLEKLKIIDVFEPNKEFHDDLRKIDIIKNIYGNLKELNQLYDIILICNTLHEIAPTQWVKILNKLKSSLTENGFLIFVEDLLLKKGERPNEFGYLILNGDELMTLLDSKETPLIIRSDDPNYKDRIMCSIFFKENIFQIRRKSVKDAIAILKKRSYEELDKLRANENCSGGREYAFFIQQYFNCEYALRNLQNKNSKVSNIERV